MIASNKPIVYYKGNAEISISMDQHGKEIRWAFLYALNHYRLGRTTVRTSLIEHITDDGIIETLNTLYVPIENTTIGEDEL